MWPPLCVTHNGHELAGTGLRERIYFHGLRRIPVGSVQMLGRAVFRDRREASVHFAFKRSDKSNQSTVSLVRLNPPRLRVARLLFLSHSNVVIERESLRLSLLLFAL